MGCRDCKHQHQQAGESQCAYQPHTFATPMQWTIAHWLSGAGGSIKREAWTDDGCPGFEDWRPVTQPFDSPTVAE